VEFFYYPAGHAFHNPGDLLGTYDAEHAKQAWQRTVEFLSTNLR
jgi:carboxymethylenebutenolidase